MAKEIVDSLIREVNINASLSCDYTVSIRGYYIEPQPCIVLELMHQGSLKDLLHDQNKVLDWNIRYKFIQSIAKGVAFLISRRILHRDLKSLNILVNEHNQCKLSDFGLSKQKSGPNNPNNNNITAATTAAQIGTYKWMPPEIINELPFTNKADIYSLGIVIWEISSRQLLSATIPQVIQGKREAIPADCPAKVRVLIESCRDIEPNNRPAAEQIVKYLNTGSINEYDINLLLPNNQNIIDEQDCLASINGLIGNNLQSVAAFNNNKMMLNLVAWQ